MSEEESPYKRIASGTGLVFSGMVIGLFLGFVTRTVLIRFLGPDQYGVVALGYTVATTAITVTKMGLQPGITRNVSATNSERSRRGIILSGLAMSLVVSVVVAAIIFASAEFLAQTIFNDQRLIRIIQTFSLAVPALTIQALVIAAFRGYERTTERVAISDLLAPVTKVSFVAVAVLLGYDFFGATVAWTGSILFTMISSICLLYSRTSILSLSWFEPHYVDLLVFSLPLLLSSTTWVVIREADNLFIGFFLNSYQVGIYDGAFLVSRLLLTGVNAFSFLFMPVFSKMNVGGKEDEMDKFYRITTKWAASMTLPLYLLVMTYPSTLLSGLFGTSYTAGSTPLMIISSGFYLYVMAGLVSNALTAIGFTKIVMYGNVVAAIGNILMNYILIPILGIEGAAIASAASYVLSNSILVYYLNKHSGIVPLSRSLVYPVVSTTGVVLIGSTLLENLITIRFVVLPLVFVGYCMVYVALFFLTGAVEEEDLTLVETVEEETGTDLNWLKRLIESRAR